MHGDLDAEHFLSNTFKENGVNVCLAPGDGLMLERVAYDRYNEFQSNKKNDVMVQKVTQTQEIEAYRKDLVAHVAQRELKNRAFVSWLSWFDDNCEQYFVKSPSEEDIKQMNILKPAVKMMHPLAEVIPWDMQLLSKSGTVSFGSLIEDQKPKLLAIYYSMHNCPPCREFTPLLASLYEEFNENEK